VYLWFFTLLIEVVFFSPKKSLVKSKPQKGHILAPQSQDLNFCRKNSPFFFWFNRFHRKKSPPNLAKFEHFFSLQSGELPRDFGWTRWIFMVTTRSTEKRWIYYDGTWHQSGNHLANDGERGPERPFQRRWEPYKMRMAQTLGTQEPDGPHNLATQAESRPQAVIGDRGESGKAWDKFKVRTTPADQLPKLKPMVNVGNGEENSNLEIKSTRKTDHRVQASTVRNGWCSFGQTQIVYASFVQLVSIAADPGGENGISSEHPPTLHKWRKDRWTSPRV
jgi:hypothetical protein